LSEEGKKGVVVWFQEKEKEKEGGNSWEEEVGIDEEDWERLKSVR
jgi:hypothetical protein